MLRTNTWFHCNFGLDGNRVARLLASGAEELSVYVAGGTNVQSGVTYFENGLGGRIGTTALCVSGAVTENLFSFFKRGILARLFERLAGSPLPVYAHNRALMRVYARESEKEGRLFVLVTSMACDRVPHFALELPGAYAKGRVEILDGSQWRRAYVEYQPDDPRRVHVFVPNGLGVFDSAALRVSK